MHPLLIVVVLAALCAAFAYGCRAVYRSDQRQQVIDVFRNHTAVRQSAQMLSDESGLSIDEVDEVLTSLEKAKSLRRFGQGTTPYYLYVEETRP